MTNVLTWEEVLKDRAAWDVFVWYGGLLTLGEMLNRTGVPAAFTTWVGASLTGAAMVRVLLVTLVIYFYSHYAFATVTVHVLAMFAPFVALLIGLGRAAEAGGVRVRVPRGASGRVDALRHDHRADVHQRLRQRQGLVASRADRLVRESRGLADRRLRLVEGAGILVTAP